MPSQLYTQTISDSIYLALKKIMQFPELVSDLKKILKIFSDKCKEYNVKNLL